MCRVENGQAISLSRIAKTSRTCQPPTFTSNGSTTKKLHKKEPSCPHVHTKLSNSSIFLHLHAAKCPLEETLEQDEKEEEDTLFEEADGKVFWSGGSIWRRHEVHRSTLYVPKEETFPCH